MEASRIRLLYLINTFEVGGAEKAMVRILTKINKDKYDITVAAIREGSGNLLPDLEKAGVIPETLKGNSKLDIMKAAYNLYSFIKKRRIEVLICSLYYSTILGRIIGKREGVPVIVNWEVDEFLGGPTSLLLNRLTMRLSDRVICDSEKVRAKVKKVLHIPNDMVEVIRAGGIELSDYDYARSCTGKSVITVGTIGRLTEQKGYLHFIKAARIVSDKVDNIRFSIVGDGKLFSQHAQLINELSLQDKVGLLGFRRDIPELLSSWQIYVQPSLWEGLCITVVEAMASGLPVVASSVGGIPESVVNGYNGFLVPPGKPEALAERILKLIYEPDLRTQMGRRSRKLAEEKYSLDKMVKHVEEVIDTLIRSKIGLIWNEDAASWEYGK